MKEQCEPTDEHTTLPTFQETFNLLGCIANVHSTFLTCYTATLIELVKEPGNGSFESFTKMFGLPVNMFKHCVNFLINIVSIGLSKLTGQLALVVGQWFPAQLSRFVNHEADWKTLVTKKKFEPQNLKGCDTILY